MRFATKFVAVAAVLGSLVCVSTASAGFTPPSSVAPYVPAANVTTAVKIASFGNVDVYNCSMGGTVAVAKGTPLASVLITAANNCAWQKFLAATVPVGERSSSAIVQSAQLWYTSNVYLPYYYPLTRSAAASAVKRR